MFRRTALLTALVALAPPAFADVDWKAIVPVLVKTLAYDVNFDARGAGDFTVLVLSAPSHSKEREKLVAQLKELTFKLKARPVKFVSADWKDEPALQSEIEKTHASALMPIAESAVDSMKGLWEVAQDNQLYALALSEGMVEKLLPVGFTMTGDKVQVVINEKAATAVGARFETTVLRAAKVLR